MNRSGGVVVFLAASAATLALLPLGFDHRLRHDWRRAECADRLRTLQRLATVRQSMTSCRVSLPAGSGRWLCLQGGPLVGPQDLALFFCPYQDSPITAGQTDFRGPARRTRGTGGPQPVGADHERNHPPCCPFNVVLNDGSLRTCRADDPWRLDLRGELLPPGE